MRENSSIFSIYYVYLVSHCVDLIKNSIDLPFIKITKWFHNNLIYILAFHSSARSPFFHHGCIVFDSMQSSFPCRLCRVLELTLKILFACKELTLYYQRPNSKVE